MGVAMSGSGIRRLFAIGLIALFAITGAFAQDARPSADEPVAAVATAPVTIDGRVLFNVRGITTYPAERRAAEIEDRIRALARDRSFDPATLPVEDEALGTRIGPVDHRVMRVTDADAETEGIPRRLFAEVCAAQIRTAIDGYRATRTKEALLAAAWQGALATVLALLSLIVVLRLSRRWARLLEARFTERVKSVTVRSFEVVRAERIRLVVNGGMRFIRLIFLAGIVFAYTRFMLGVIPWTHGAASQVDGWVLAPIGTLGRGLVAELPDLIFLAILFIVFRYILRLIELFFSAVGRGDVTLDNFDAEWAQPTYKILRVAVIAFGVIVAYPYIPGSSSEAFKGVTLFMGVLFSLGSSSVISNIVAGYTMIYRRAFREGDVVKIGDVAGRVTHIRVQVTHLRTPKNEEIIVPNSTIMGAEVVNYSSLAKSDGLVLNTTVRIGYETPWRQVEAILLTAADRTEGLAKQPKPFVLATALGDFAITYQINAYSDDPTRMVRTYSELHRNMLDVFNEHGVQIMTPAYEGDPEQPKLVPPDRKDWPR